MRVFESSDSYYQITDFDPDLDLTLLLCNAKCDAKIIRFLSSCLKLILRHSDLETTRNKLIFKK